MGNTDILIDAFAADDAQSGDDLMGISRQHLKHFCGVFPVCRLAEHFSVYGNDRIASDYNRLGVQSQNGFCLASGKTSDFIRQIISVIDGFINIRRLADEGNAAFLQQFSAAGTLGGKNQLFHENNYKQLRRK